jgi:ribonuclease P protein component
VSAGAAKKPRAVPAGPRAAAGKAAKPNAFPHSEHLSGLEFLRVMAKGQKKSCPSFHLYFMPSADFQAGVVVARRLGGAVERNKIKRVLREAIRLTRIVLGQPCHLVVVARPGAERLDVETAKVSLSELCGSARLLEPAKL